MDASDNVEATISGQAGSSGQVVPEENADQPSADYLQWLESRSMLHQADHLADLVTRRFDTSVDLLAAANGMTSRSGVRPKQVLLVPTQGVTTCSGLEGPG